MIGSVVIWRCAALATCAAIAAVVFIAPGPDTNLRSAIAIHDFGHVVAFGLVTLLFVFALSTPPRSTFRGRVSAICLAAGAAMVFGATVELAQAVAGLHGDPWDVARNAGGAVSVALILIPLDPVLSSRARAALASAAVFTFAVFTYPVFAALEDEARARKQFPALANFESRRELSRFDFAKARNPRIVTLPDSEDGLYSAVQLRLPTGKYPGIWLRYFPGDWRGMRALQLLIFNPEAKSIELTVRIDDAEHDSRLGLEDRYYQSFPLLPGINRIEIPLSNVTAAPSGRRFDLGRVKSLLVFAVNLEQPHDIAIGPIVLLR